jgi:glycosyltransferase involved in cell wall biosynthesis
MSPDALSAVRERDAGDRAPGKRRVLGMALYGDLTHDSRVRREAASLAAAGWSVVIACLASSGPTDDLGAGVSVRVLRPTSSAVLPGSDNPFGDGGGGRLARLRRRAAWLRGYVANLRGWGRLAIEAVGAVDAWHLHDLTALAAVAPAADPRIPIVYDAHELFLETGTALRLPRPARSLLRAYEGRLARRAVAVVTVNHALADELARRFRLRRVIAVHNCPAAWSPPATRPTLLRKAAGVPASSPVLLYHGALSVNRGVEQLMAALSEAGLEAAHLVLMGFGELRDAYARAADATPDGRVHLLDPVPPSALLDWVAGADIGVMPIQPSTANHRMSTPNKLFECIAAGVPIVASDFPAIRRIVLGGPDGPIGAVCDPTSVPDVARAIRAILAMDRDALAGMRARSLAAAASEWNWERQMAGLAALYAGLPAPR